jgi:hypothetical protein
MHASRAGADSPGLRGCLTAAIPSLYGMPGGADCTGEHLSRCYQTGCAGFSPPARY